MNAMGLERPILIGHSLGCQVAVETALQYPERFDRLVLMGLTPDPAARRPAIQFLRFLQGSTHERPSLSFHLVKDYTRMGKRLLPEFQAMLEDPIEAKLPRLQVPVMLVRGKKDAIAPQRWLEQAAHLVGTAQVVVIPQGGHAVHYRAAEPLATPSGLFYCRQRRARSEALCTFLQRRIATCLEGQPLSQPVETTSAVYPLSSSLAVSVREERKLSMSRRLLDVFIALYIQPSRKGNWLSVGAC